MATLGAGGALGLAYPSVGIGTPLGARYRNEWPVQNPCIARRVIGEHLEAFLRAAAEAGEGSGLPQFVEREFREFLTCGVFDVLTCPRCGGRMRLIATIHDPGVIRRILAHLSLSHSGQSPGPAPPDPAAAH